MDGSTPVVSSPLCQDSVRIVASVTLKARAFKEGSVPSRVDSADFVIDARQTYALPGAWIASTAVPTALVLGKDSSLEITSIPASVSFASPAERTRGTWQLRDSLLAFTLVASTTSPPPWPVPRARSPFRAWSRESAPPVGTFPAAGNGTS